MYHQAIIVSTDHPVSTIMELEEILLEHLPASFVLADSNPDILQIRRSKSSIGIAEIQPLVTWNQQKPYQGDYKLGIIFGAERMTPEAQNSLLKTLEEPSPGTLLCLITQNRSALLPTIRSRSQTRALRQTPTPAIPDANVSEFLAAQLPTRLQVIARLTDAEESREAALEFVSALMRQIVSTALTAPEYTKYLEVCKMGYIGLKSGANIKLTLETIVISMD